MSSVETPPPPTEVERRCPQCGAHLSADQEWCLECGAAVSTRIAAPRGWRASVAVVGLLLALALIAVVLALVELARDPEQVTEAAATPTPVPTVAPTTTPAPGPTTTPTPPAAESTPSPGVAEWPEGETAWTVIFNSSGTREDAERIAGELAAKGVPDVGVLDSDDFDSLGPDSFVVFSGQHDSREQAERVLASVRDRSGGGSTRRIVPKEDAAGGSATPEAGG